MVQIDPKVLRFLFPALCALVVTILSFYMMQVLIRALPESDGIVPIQLSSVPILRINEVKRRDVRKKPIRVLPADPPDGQDELPDFPRQTLSRADYVTVGSIGRVMTNEMVEFMSIPPISSVVPLRVVQPVYPLKAVMREIEGHVLVQFSIGENGSVVNPFIIESEPGRIFDKAALDAIMRFKFQPRTLDQVSYVVQDMQLRFAFRLESNYDGYRVIPRFGLGHK